MMRATYGDASAASAAGHPPHHVEEQRLLKLEVRDESYLVDLFAILQATEHLELAKVREAVPDGDYELQVLKLLNAFGTICKTLGMVADADVRAFMHKNGIGHLSLATQRLVVDKMPATLLHLQPPPGGGGGVGGVGGGGHGYSTTLIIETSLEFVTTMDWVMYNAGETAFADDLLRRVRSLVEKLNAFVAVRADWPARVKLRDWLRKLAAKQATDVVPMADRRQLSADMETALTDIKREGFLSGGGNEAQ